VIVLDTSVLIDGLTGLKRSAPAIRESLAGERMVLPALVLYEWLRGPRLAQELAAQEALFPANSSIAFGPEEAAVSAGLWCARRIFGPSVPATSALRPVFGVSMAKRVHTSVNAARKSACATAQL